MKPLAEESSVSVITIYEVSTWQTAADHRQKLMVHLGIHRHIRNAI